MNLGIIGSGKIVKEILPVIKEIDGINLSGITARNEENLINLCRKYGIVNYYLDIDRLLKNPDIDTVYLALPNHMHYEIMKKALGYGKNIICEKPFTTNFDQAIEIYKLAKDNNLIVLEAMTNRFIPNALEVKKLIAKADDIKIVSFNYSQYSSRYDKFKQGIIEPVFDPNKAGGSLMDLNIYNLSYCLDLFGRPSDIKYLANMDRGIDTSGILILDYESFKAVLIGAKDCAASLNNTIQASNFSIEINDSLNEFRSFDIIENGKDRQSKNYNKLDKHRVYYEFLEFYRIIRDKDYKKAARLGERTLLLCELLTKARLDAGIIFPDDK